MAQDIEEFLRMAAARKKQQRQQTQTQQSQPAQQPASQQPAAQQPAGQRQQTQRTQRSQQGNRDADVYILDDLDTVEAGHSELQSRLRTTVSTDDIVEHTSHLGEGVHNRTDVVDARVNQKFDHELGSLRKDDLEAPAVVDHGKGHESFTDISGVLRMLRNPASLKQAIILKEIFDRPKF